MDVIKHNWKVHIDGHNMFKVVSKLKRMKKPLLKLLHDHDNLHDRVNKLRIELDQVQTALDLNPADANLRDEERETANTGFFHKTIKSNHNRSRIEVILNAANTEVSGSQVPEVFVAHYEQFLGTSTACNALDMEDLFFNKVSDLTASNMVRNITNEEILTNRIIEGIKEVVSDNQSAFVPGRRISDNILITQKLMHNYPRNRGPPRCAFKISKRLMIRLIGLFWIAKSLLKNPRTELVIGRTNLYLLLEDYNCLIHGFLWCNDDYKRGKAKVAWEDICLPKGRSRSLTPRDITREGFHIRNKVADLVSNGAWNWPHFWLQKALELNPIATSNIEVSRADIWQWRDSNGLLSAFSVTKLWEAIRPRGLQLAGNPMRNKRTARMYILGKLIKRCVQLQMVGTGAQVGELYYFFLRLDFSHWVFLGKVFKESFLDPIPPYFWKVDVAAWKLCKANWDVS
ncbi:hypothetical protein Tco_0757019 [Tanacetum coccineum]